jgi:hypothetical protein
MWLLVLLAMRINDPQDVPGRITLEFPTEESCKTSLKTFTYWLKFDTYKIVGQCEKKK